MLPPKKLEQFKRLFETRIAELESNLVSAQRETRVDAAKQADPGDQAASEYERLKQALERLRQGSFGECAECGGDIEPKRLEAIP